MTDEVVTWSSADGVCTVRLDRPPVNALGYVLVDGLTAALDAFDASDDRVLVLTSALDRFFMAGADIKAMSGYSETEFAAYGAWMRVAFERIARHRRPSIAAIDGAALGGGLELALAATLRVAGRDATLGVPEIKLGLIPGAGGTQRLPRLVGRSRALDMMLTPRTVAAAEAHAIGLVDRLVDAGTAAAAAGEWARTLAAMPASAMTAVLRCVDDAGSLPLDEGLTAEADRVTALFGEPDAAEGLAAFVERRAPRFG